LILRSYQRKVIDDIRAAFRAGHRRVLLVMPTGSGKTACIQEIARGNQDKGKRAWFIEHRRELIEQSSKSFTAAGIPHAVVSAGRIENRYARIQIASVQTIAGRLDEMPVPDLIMPDEAHHASASQWRQVMTHHGVPLIGCTATPCRLDGRPLGEFFDVMVLGPEIRELIDMPREDGLPGGYLADYRLFVAPTGESVVDIPRRGGEIPGEAVYKRVRGAKRTGDIIQHYGDLANGVRAIVFACTIADSIELAGAFCAAGIRAEHMDGDMRDADRSAAFARFESGVTSVLSAVDLFGEGLHVPGVGCVIHARPTASLSKYMQANGRGFAPKVDGSSLIILDHAGNSGAIENGLWVPNHGFPDDPREWSLTGTVRRPQSGDPAIAIRECPKCGGVLRASVRRCPDPCGYDFPAAIAKPIREQGGVLVEIDTRTAKQREKDDARAARLAAKAEREERKRLQAELDERLRHDRKREEMDCATIEELIRLFTARGYTSPAGAARHKWPYIEMGRSSRNRAQQRARHA
jgi:DNA repair protein RadD